MPPKPSSAIARLDELPFEIEDVRVSRGAVEHPGMIMTPRTPMVMSRDRLARISTTATLSPVERGLIEEARRRGVRLALIRGADDTGRLLWQFDPEIPDSELAEAGLMMGRGLLPFHRSLAAAGVMLLGHTEWGLRDCYAMREGVARLAAERKKEGGPLAELDEWILRNMLLHVGLGVRHVVDSLLPSHVTMVDRRVERVRAILEKVPADAL